MSKKRKPFEKQEEKLMLEFLGEAEILNEWDIKPRKIKKSGNEYRIKTSRGEKVLKIAYQEDRVLFMYHVLEHLAGKGYYRGIPRLIPTKYGDCYVKTDMGIYYLTDWLEGKENKVKDLDHAMKLVKHLAEIHLALKDLHHVPDSAVRERWDDLSQHMAGYMQNILRKLPHLPHDFQEAWLTFESMARRAQDLLRLSGMKELIEKAKKEKTVCHRQFRPKNVVISDHQINVLDWEHCAFGVQVADLVSFMHKTMPGFDWDYGIGEQVVQAYNQVKPLSPEELMTIGAALMFPLAFVKIGEKCYAKKIEEKKIYRKLKKIMEQEQKKIAFLEKFLDHHDLKGLCWGKSSFLVSNLWYLNSPNDLTGYMKSGVSDITCFFYLSYTVSPQGRLQEQFDMRICKISQENKVPVIPVIFTPKQSKEQVNTAVVLADRHLREKLISEIDRILEIYDFPGVNIKFDLTSHEEKRDFNAFIKSLSQEIRSKGKMLLVSVMSAKGQELYYDYEFLGTACDYVLVEILDENLLFPGPLASKRFIKASLTYAGAYIPLEKIVAVLPVYGYRWVIGKSMRYTLSYAEAEKLVLSQKGKLETDHESGCLWAKVNIDDQENEIWIEDAESLFEKMLLARQFGTAGCGFWRLGLEDSRLWTREPEENVNIEESFNDQEEEDDEEDD